MPAGYKFGEMKLMKERSQKKAKAWDSRDCCLEVETEAYLRSCQTSMMKYFPKIVKGFQPLTIFAKRSILDVWQGFKYPSVEPTFLRCIIVI